MTATKPTAADPPPSVSTTVSPPAASVSVSSPSRTSRRRWIFVLLALVSVGLLAWQGACLWMLSQIQTAISQDQLAAAEYWIERHRVWSLRPAQSVFEQARVARLSGDIDRCQELLVMAENFGTDQSAVQAEKELLLLQSGSHPSLQIAASADASAPLEDEEKLEATANGLHVIGASQAAIELLDAREKVAGPAAKRLALKANVLADLGQDQESLAAFEQAVALDPNLISARIGLAERLLVDDRLNEALPHYLQVIDSLGAYVRPGDVEAADVKRYINSSLAASEILLRSKRQADAIQRLERLIALYPENFAARLLLSNAYAQGGQHERVVQILQPLLERFPRDVSVLYALATAETELGHAEKADEYMQEYLRGREVLDELQKTESALRGQPPTPEMLLSIAERYLEFRWDDAEPWLERAYRLDRGDPRVLAAWGKYYRKLGENRQAARYSEAAKRATRPLGEIHGTR